VILHAALEGPLSLGGSSNHGGLASSAASTALNMTTQQQRARAFAPHEHTRAGFARMTNRTPAGESARSTRTLFFEHGDLALVLGDAALAAGGSDDREDGQ